MKATFRQHRHQDKKRLQWAWTIYGDNGEPMARSTESYDNRDDMLAAFEAITDTLVLQPHDEEGNPHPVLAAGRLQSVDPPRRREIEVEWEIEE